MLKFTPAEYDRPLYNYSVKLYKNPKLLCLPNLKRELKNHKG